MCKKIIFIKFFGPALNIKFLGAGLKLGEGTLENGYIGSPAEIWEEVCPYAQWRCPHMTFVIFS